MAHLCLGRRKLLGIEIAIKRIRGRLINEFDQHAVAIFGSVVPYEEKVVKVVEVGSTEGNEFVKGEVVRNGEDKEKSGGRG